MECGHGAGLGDQPGSSHALPPARWVLTQFLVRSSGIEGPLPGASQPPVSVLSCSAAALSEEARGASPPAQDGDQPDFEGSDPHCPPV